MSRLPPSSTLFPYTTLFRSREDRRLAHALVVPRRLRVPLLGELDPVDRRVLRRHELQLRVVLHGERDRKSTRLNSSHEWVSYAVFCLKKKTAIEWREGVSRG